jgi:hypothetical protein
MALIDYTIPDPGTNQQVPKGVKVVAWLNMFGSDRGKAYRIPQATAKSVQAIGGAITIEGSNQSGDVSTGATSSDWDSLGTTSTINNVLAPVYQIRPRNAGTSTTVSIDVYLMVRTDARG